MQPHPFRDDDGDGGDGFLQNSGSDDQMEVAAAAPRRSRRTRLLKTSLNADSLSTFLAVSSDSSNSTSESSVLFEEDSINDVSGTDEATLNDSDVDPEEVTLGPKEKIACQVEIQGFLFPTPNVAHPFEGQTKYPSLLSKKEKTSMRVMSYCDANGCSRQFYDGLMKLLTEEAVDNEYDFRDSHFTRKRLLTKLHRINVCAKPIPLPVTLENKHLRERDYLSYERGEREVAVVISYDFSSQLMDLLHDDSIFGNLDNLDVNPDNPYGRYISGNDEFDEVNSAYWYGQAYDHCIKDDMNEMLFPIIMYIDKTGTDALQRHALEPLLFTTSVISWKRRQDIKSWRPLGFVPDLCGTSSATKQVESRGCSVRNYHKCLRTILESFVNAQKDGLVVELRLGNTVKLVRLRIPLAFIINDGKSGDAICGRYGQYATGRISRHCYTEVCDCDDGTHYCEYILHGDIKDMVSKAHCMEDEADDSAEGAITNNNARRQAKSYLDEIKQHEVRNAFDDVCFGGDPRGIFGATPTDLMHAFQEGVLKYAMQIIFMEMSAKTKVSVDKLVDKLIRKQKSSSRYLFPRCDFSKGYTNLTLLTASEWVGVSFTLLIILHLSEGRRIMSEYLMKDFNRKRNDKYETMIEKRKEQISAGKECGQEPRKPVDLNLSDLQILVEALMFFHLNLKEGFGYDGSENDFLSFEKSVRELVTFITNNLPRLEGNGWKIQKLHEMLHLPDDIHRFGCPRNWDAGPGERSLKYFAKHPATTCQQRKDVFLGQVCSRLHETALIRTAGRLTDTSVFEFMSTNNRRRQKETTDHVSEDDIQSSVRNNQSKFHITFPKQVKTYPVARWVATNKRAATHEVHRVVTDWFKSDAATRIYEDEVACFTEYVRDNQIFRAHPNFRGNCPWYDWVALRFKDSTVSDDEMNNEEQEPTSSAYFVDELDNKDFYPAKILCFFVDPIDKEMHALVHCCNDCEDIFDSNMTQIWFLEYQQRRNPTTRTKLAEPIVRKVSVDAFGSILYVMQDTPGVHSHIDVSKAPDYDRCVVVRNRRVRKSGP
jgi:hypothetical protein